MKAIGYLVGAGSMSIGVEAAGFKVQEVWETAGYARNAGSWDLNRPQARHQVLDLNWTSDHFKERSADLIYGNPPCGDMSSMTGSKADSKTNDLMRHWLRMVVKGRPRMILMENGFQLASPRMERQLMDLGLVLNEAGYDWWTWDIYSHQLGTPQNRRRMFLCASLGVANETLIGLDDLPDRRDKAAAPAGAYLWPLYDTQPTPDGLAMNRDGNQVTMHCYSAARYTATNAALTGNRDRIQSRYVPPKLWSQLEVMANRNPGLYAKRLERARPRLWADCPPLLDFGREFRRPKIVPEGASGPTIIGEFIYVHPREDRLLTMREMALLMGYPMDWKFQRPTPAFIGQGVPARNAEWAARRLAQVAGAVQ